MLKEWVLNNSGERMLSFSCFICRKNKLRAVAKINSSEKTK